MFSFFKKQSEPEVDVLASASGRKDIISRLKDMGYYIRPKRIRKPKIGDTIKFRVGMGWSNNGHYYQTGIVEEIDYSNWGVILAKKKNKKGIVVAIHYVHPLQVVKVSKTRETPNLAEEKKG